MNTLDDLRDTLAREAGSAPNAHHTELSRTARSRAAQHRQRQRALAAFVAVGAIGTAGLVASWPDDSGSPVADTVFGIDVPQEQRSLGWTYDLEVVEARTDAATVEVELPASGEPMLVSWATEGDDDAVRVTRPYERVPYASSAGDFDDFVWVPPGDGGVVKVQASAPGVALAVYAIDREKLPAGVGDISGPFFRRDVAGQTLLGAAVGDPGEARVEVEVDVPDDEDSRIGLAHTCAAAPKGTQVHVGIAGEEGDLVFGVCQGEESDPGGSLNSVFEKGEFAGRRVTFQVWLTRRGVELSGGDAADVRVGLGVYLVNESSVEAAGQQFDEVLESHGRTWQLAEVVTGKPTELRVRVPRDGGTYLLAAGSDGAASYRVRADGTPLDEVVRLGAAGAIGEVMLPPGTSEAVLQLTRAEGQEGVLLLYRMES